MRLSVETHDDVAVVQMRGRLVSGVGDIQLRDTMNRLLGEGQRKILLDLTEVSHIDSSGVGELVASQRIAARFGSLVKVIPGDQGVQHVLQLSRILPLLDTYDSQQEGLAAFADEEPPEPEIAVGDA